MTAADLARVERPAVQLTADMAAAVLREAIAREVALHDDYEVSALSESLFLVTHPDVAVSTDADYAGTPWAAWLADRIKQNQQPGGTA